MFVRIALTSLMLSMSTYAVGSDNAIAIDDNEAVSVLWIAPEKYRDVDAVYMNKRRYRQSVMDELTLFIQEEVKGYLGKDQRIAFKIHDLDLAGAIRPLIGQLNNIRIVKSIYPPMIDFEYQLSNNQGQTIESKRKKFRDIAFNLRTTSRHKDTLTYEKEMIVKLIKNEFKK